MIVVKKIVKTLTLAVLAFGALPALAAPLYHYSPDFFDSTEHGDCTSAIEEQVGKLVKDAAAITEIDFMPTYGPGDEDTIVEGYEGWVSFSNCEGNLVIKTDRQCRVNQVYTRYKCQIEGVPNY